MFCRPGLFFRRIKRSEYHDGQNSIHPIRVVRVDFDLGDDRFRRRSNQNASHDGGQPDGEDILTPLVEPAAQMIVDAAAKK